MSEYTPSMDRVRNMYARIMKPDGTVALWSRRQKEFDSWLSAHDQALREQVARDLMEKLPRILAETSGDSFGWLSDGLYKNAEADSMDSEVYVRDGGIDLDQIAEYAARIVGGK